MKSVIIIQIIILLTIIPKFGFCQTDSIPGVDTVATSTSSKSPLTFKKFIEKEKDYKKIDATFPIYEIGEKYYMDFPFNHLEEEILITAQMVKGIGVRGSGLKAAGVVKIKKGPNHKLFLYNEYHSERVTSEDAELANVLKSNLLPISAVYPIVAYNADSSGYLFEVTSLIKGTGSWYKLSDEGTVEGTKQKTSSGNEFTFVDEIIPEENGVKFLLTWIVDQNFTGIECKFKLLPKEKMRIRFADPKVGYENLSYIDYESNPYGVKRETIITKWNLVPKNMDSYSKGILTEPENPIVFYLDNYFPKELKERAINGVLQWQEAFEKAGFKNAIQVRMAKDENELTSARAVITYSPNSGSSSTILERDLRTGEILQCRININHSILGNHIDNYFIRCCMVDDRIVQNPLDGNVVGNIIEWTVAQQVGYGLGLLPNLAGSYAYTTKEIRNDKFLKKNGFSASVLDAMLNYVVQPEDMVDPDELLPRVGVYDKWAIEWGYRVFPESENSESDRKLLREMVKKSESNPALLYLADTQHDPRALSSDLCSDKINVAKLGIKNMEYLFNNFERLTEKRDADTDTWHSVGELGHTAIWLSYQNLVYKVAEGMGGRMRIGDEEVFASKKEQKEIMKFLKEYVFSAPQKWCYNKVLVRQLGYSPEHTRIELMEVIMSYLLKPQIYENMDRAVEKDGGKAYSSLEYLADLQYYLFNNFESKYALTPFERQVQNSFLNCFIDNATNRELLSNSLNDYSNKMLYLIRNIRSNAERLSTEHTDEMMRNHYRSMVYRIDRDIKTLVSRLKS